jgi:hypothetical protein
MFRSSEVIPSSWSKTRQNLPHPHYVTTKEQKFVFVMETESVFCEVDEFKPEKLGYDTVQNGI